MKQSQEPSYSTRLQNIPGHFYSNLPPTKHSNTYSNVSSEQNLQYSNVWPDGNPRAAPQEPNFRGSNTSLDSTMPRSSTHHASASNLSITSGSNIYGSSSNLVPKGYTKPDSGVTYSNIQVGQSRNRDGLIYSNLMHPPRDGGMYSNVPGSRGNVYSNGGR